MKCNNRFLFLLHVYHLSIEGGWSGDRDCMVVGFTTLCDKDCQ